MKLDYILLAWMEQIEWNNTGWLLADKASKKHRL